MYDEADYVSLFPTYRKRITVIASIMAAVGEPDVKEKLKKGHQANGKEFKVHLDGYNFLPHLMGKEEKGPRKEFFYFNDGGEMVGLRYNNWKVHFMVQDQEGTLEIWLRTKS